MRFWLACVRAAHGDRYEMPGLHDMREGRLLRRDRNVRREARAGNFVHRQQTMHEGFVHWRKVRAERCRSAGTLSRLNQYGIPHAAAIAENEKLHCGQPDTLLIVLTV